MNGVFGQQGMSHTVPSVNDPTQTLFGFKQEPTTINASRIHSTYHRRRELDYGCTSVVCVHVHVLHSSSFTRAAIARRQSWVHYGKRSKVSLSRAMTDFSDMWCLLYVIV